jgi:hypothetical protein
VIARAHGRIARCIGLQTALAFANSVHFPASARERVTGNLRALISPQNVGNDPADCQRLLAILMRMSRHARGVSPSPASLGASTPQGMTETSRAIWFPSESAIVARGEAKQDQAAAA